MTDLVTSWLDGNLDVDRATLVDAIVTMGRTLGVADSALDSASAAQNRE